MRPVGTMRSLRAASAPSMTPSSLDHAGQEQLADHLDDAGAADAGDAERRRGLGEFRLVGPVVAADHLHLRLQRRRVDAHALDGAGRGALAAGNLGALEGRAGRRGGGDEALPVAEHDLGVGADIDQERDLLAAVRAFGERRAGGVGADMAGDAGKRVDARALVHRQADVARRGNGALPRRRARRARRRARSGRCRGRGGA